MANPALNIANQSNYLVNRDIFVFDGNSQSAHIIARTVLVNDPYQQLNLIPKQNTSYFGIEVPTAHSEEKFIVMTRTGDVLVGDAALQFVTLRLKLETKFH